MTGLALVFAALMMCALVLAEPWRPLPSGASPEGLDGVDRCLLAAVVLLLLIAAVIVGWPL